MTPPAEPLADPRPGYCRTCGARIWWVKLVSGKSIPVNHERIVVRMEGESQRDDGGSTTIVTRDGRTLRGVRMPPRRDPGPGQAIPAGFEVGGRAHFATCPQADERRRAIRKARRAAARRRASSA